MSTRELQCPGGVHLSIDEKGYLLDHTAWSPLVAETMVGSAASVTPAPEWTGIVPSEDSEDVDPASFAAAPGVIGRAPAVTRAVGGVHREDHGDRLAGEPCPGCGAAVRQPLGAQLTLGVRLAQAA